MIGIWLGRDRRLSGERGGGIGFIGEEVGPPPPLPMFLDTSRYDRPHHSETELKDGGGTTVRGSTKRLRLADNILETTYRGQRRYRTGTFSNMVPNALARSDGGFTDKEEIIHTCWRYRGAALQNGGLQLRDCPDLKPDAELSKMPMLWV
jgi:hypothetical protein